LFCWIFFVSSVPLGSIPELPAESCKEIKASEGQVVSGKYWLSSIKPGMSLLAHCDMATEGGLGSKRDYCRFVYHETELRRGGFPQGEGEDKGLQAILGVV